MPPQNTPIPSPESIDPQKVETTPQVPSPEVQPEVAPQPVSPEVPRTETFSDQQTQSPQQTVVTPDPVAQPVEPTPEVEMAEQQEVEKTGGVADTWVDAVETIIEKDQGKPFEEEEDAEKINISYQQKTFGKQIQKDPE